ncbi:MAG: 4-hydroxythreonine-4-phosphate dehydrogenase PdxA [Rikenellaceae bacterium]|nr:4-hydroxythreonine-4-phosphate dehydrogenase PdxA [Rikenellaceae bacterium]
MDGKIRVGITHGDINGIGYEIIVKTFMDQRTLDICTPVIYGSSKVLRYYKKNIPGGESLSFNQIRNAEDALPRKVNLLNCVEDNIRVEPGKSDVVAGQAAAASLNAAVRDIREGKIDVLVTAPINKANIQCDEFDFTGHTEFLDANFHDTEPLMMMVGDSVRVGLTTIHIPLSEVSSRVNSELILKKLRAIKRSLVSDFSIRDPKIAVLSLNPHAGDDGLLGSEEKEVISPAVISANDEGILAFGPFAADGFFGSGAFAKYDAVLAMYHDQGLAPFKALCPESGVNFTAGLSIVRTSPAHGVGYDIAGKNLADPSSFRAAVYSAVDIWNNRNIYNRITANPLKHYKVEGGADISVKDIETEEEN